ncbi:hypothetical protein ACNPON_14160, partial [Glutamicibacter sp. AGC13]
PHRWFKPRQQLPGSAFMTRPGPNMAKCPENLGSFPSLGRNMPETLGGYQNRLAKPVFAIPARKKLLFPRR